MSLLQNISKSNFEKPVYAASLAVFRVLFGLMIVGSVIRFWVNDWIYELYIQPKFFFHYYGFEWIKPLGEYTYILFAVCGISALFFALGLFYRISSVILFFSFTYIELMDKTNYLNHYYFVSLVLFLMMWLPANVRFSLDAVQNKNLSKRFVPLWCVGSLRLMLCIVYVYAGLAKLNTDWLFEAMPLRLWLPAKNDLPIIGFLFNKIWVAYLFSWFGAFYDLTIPFFLLNKKTRTIAYITVIVFHVLTWLLFPIGVFPFVMITSAIIFFPTESVDKNLNRLQSIFNLKSFNDRTAFVFRPFWMRVTAVAFILFFAFQFIFPWRYLTMPGSLFWTEEGYRFSWRVMLMEKMGYAQFVVKDKFSNKIVPVNNNDFLTKNQEKMMATQPDFIVQYANILHDHYQQQGMMNPEVYATIYVTLNGRRSKLYVDTSQNLALTTDNFKHKNWIMPFNDEIRGL